MLFNHYVNIRGQHLNAYRYTSGGGMLGGYFCQTIKRGDDGRAIISIEEAECHNDEPKIEEYYVDASILDDLERIIRKNRMNFWNRRKFSNMFIADGESRGYCFEFDKKQISFSSQHYPVKYSNKLHKLKEVIEAYLEKIEM